MTAAAWLSSETVLSEGDRVLLLSTSAVLVTLSARRSPCPTTAPGSGTFEKVFWMIVRKVIVPVVGPCPGKGSEPPPGETMPPRRSPLSPRVTISSDTRKSIRVVPSGAAGGGTAPV